MGLILSIDVGTTNIKAALVDEDGRLCGEAKNILLLLNYLSDGDTDLPLKAFEIRIIGQK